MDNYDYDYGYDPYSMPPRRRYSSRSKLAAALLCFFFGGIGIHRFYMGYTGAGITMAVLTVVGTLTTAILVGLVPLFIVGIWTIVDFFRILFGSLPDAQGLPMR